MKLNVSTIKGMWEASEYYAGHEQGNNIIDEKACNAYYDRLDAAIKAAPQGTDMDTIDIDVSDVKVTIADRVYHWLMCHRISQMIICIWAEYKHSNDWQVACEMGY